MGDDHDLVDEDDHDLVDDDDDAGAGGVWIVEEWPPLREGKVFVD